MHTPRDASNLLSRLWRDDAGVILSAEIVLVGTILVIGMIVGLVEMQYAVVGELSDVGDAIGNLDQSYTISGITAMKTSGGIKSSTSGARYNDSPHEGDCNSIIVCDSAKSQGEKSFQ